MQILEQAEVFSGTFDDPEFLHTAIVYRDNEDNVFLAHVPDRLSTNINFDKLEGILIDPDRVFPFFDSAAFTFCPYPTSSDVFVKRPSLLAYDPGDNMVRETLLQEAQVCEALKKFRQCQHCRIFRLRGEKFTDYGSMFQKIRKNSV